MGQTCEDANDVQGGNPLDRFKLVTAPFPPTQEEMGGMLRRVLEIGAQDRADLVMRFMERTEIRDCGYDTPCWVWVGPTSGKTGRGRDYGRISYQGSTHAVHILSFTIAFGPIGRKKQIDHKCAQRACWNPDHLEQVTHALNQLRRDNKRCVSRRGA